MLRSKHHFSFLGASLDTEKGSVIHRKGLRGGAAPGPHLGLPRLWVLSFPWTDELLLGVRSTVLLRAHPTPCHRGAARPKAPPTPKAWDAVRRRDAGPGALRLDSKPSLLPVC